MTKRLCYCAIGVYTLETKRNCCQECHSSKKLQGGNIIFIDVGLTLFHCEMFQITWDFICLLSWYGSYYILKGKEF